MLWWELDPTDFRAQPYWVSTCLRDQGRILTGAWAHWCDHWDGMAIDETTPEFQTCPCDITPLPAYAR